MTAPPIPLTTHKLVAVSKAIVLFPPDATTVSTYIAPGNAMPGTGGPVLPTDPTPLTPTGLPLKCGEINTDYEISIGIVCGMCFIFGIIFNIFGKYKHSVVFITLEVSSLISPFCTDSSLLVYDTNGSL